MCADERWSHLEVSKPARMGIVDSGLNALRPPIQHKLFAPQAHSCSGPSPDSHADLAVLCGTAWDAHAEQRGVCRDFAHLAITLCRCMNVPARYCTGYLGDIGVPLDGTPMDFSAWFEVYLGDRWYTFDARHNKPRIGRILMARGREPGGG
jgi:hypothetical protein